MRLAKAIAMAGALAVMAAAAASAAPLIPNPGPAQATNIVQVAGGCGRGAHPNRWGRCVPNHYGYYRPIGPDTIMAGVGRTTMSRTILIGTSWAGTAGGTKPPDPR
jgi:hypothetical protein